MKKHKAMTAQMMNRVEKAVKAGADLLVSRSNIFRNSNRKKAVRELRSRAKEGV